ncbi:MAG TPA: galactokinase [Clostridia bacterium]|nr:galactokinase [Clostridia bacterium]
MSNQVLLQDFERVYGTSDSRIRVFFAPGRVNLIGELIDYNGGLVMPAAIALGITAVCRARSDRIARLRSSDDSLPVEIDLDQPIEPDPSRGWGNYPAGVLRELLHQGSDLVGADVLFTTTLPQGAGLSSSAAMEVLTAFCFLALAELPLSDLKGMALLCQKAENQFVGVNCGIMDQFAVALCRQDHALLLDCDSQDFTHIPVAMGEYALVIMNTSRQRRLAESKYNERRAECEAVLRLLGTDAPHNGLVHAQWSDVLSHVADPILQRRARHVITEHKRVQEASRVLTTGDLVAFGKLLNESHTSLRDDYEVTGSYLDAIVSAAQQAPGCLGARMTGAGFAGCAIALVRQADVSAFTAFVRASYAAMTGIDPSFYETRAVDGVHETTGDI